MAKIVEIPLERYEELLEAELMLQALKGAGVDNWLGYPGAMKILDDYREQIKQDG